MGDCTVSIITPIYNAASFLAEAIESVRSQKNFDAWELLLVDDGSEDLSASIAAEFGEQDDRIRLLHHPGNRNRGSSASRNLAIEQARGEYIALLDADDVWLPGTLRYRVDCLEQQPQAAMIYGAAERWYSWDPANSTSRDFVVPAHIPGFGSDLLIPPPEVLHTYLQDESATPCTCTVMFRLDAVRRHGCFEESFPGLYDDQVFYAKICLAEPVYVTSRCLARYRQHTASCCATARRNDACEKSRATFLRWLRQYAKICSA